MENKDLKIGRSSIETKIQGIMEHGGASHHASLWKEMRVDDSRVPATVTCVRREAH